MSRMTPSLVLAALLALGLSASAAELPSRAAKPKPVEKARACEIQGQSGLALAGGVCMKISGSVSVGATVGDSKH